MCIGSRATNARTVLQNWQDKTPKASPKKLSIMEHFPGLPQDSKPLRSALETERRCFSKVILESNVTPNITRPTDSFSTVPPIDYDSDWGCIVHDLDTIIVLVLLAFNFIPQRPHQSLTFTRSRLRDSATATLRPGDGSTAIIVESSV